MNKSIISTILFSALALLPLHANAQNNTDTSLKLKQEHIDLATEFLNVYNRSINQNYNLANINITESKQVTEDYLNVHLRVFEQGDDREIVQQNLLQYYNPAVEELKKEVKKYNDYEKFEIKNTQIRVFPQQIYNKDGVLVKTLWKGEATIYLGGNEIERINKIANNLEGFTISGISMQVSNRLRNQTMKELQSTIVSNFKDRAIHLSNDFGFDGKFTIKEINVNYENNQSFSNNIAFKGQPRLAHAMAAEMAIENEPISTAPGQVTISAYMSGTIILGDINSKN